MKKINLLSLLVLVPIVTFAETQWVTGHYSNNANISKTLSIESAENLEIKILGTTERNYDFITLKDKDGKQIGRFSGAISETIAVEGSSITATLTSDYSVTKAGITITIEDPNADEAAGPKYSTGAYKNNELRTYKMIIPDGFCADSGTPNGCFLALKGETEKDYDFVRITDDKGRKLGSFSGKLSNKAVNNISSNTKFINITLISDGSIIKSGVTMSLHPILMTP